MDNNVIRILLVEDDVDFGSALVSRLTKRNFTVELAESAEAALDKLRRANFHAVISDIKLPGMDGTKFLARVRELHDSIPVILLTGYASLESAKEAVKLNASDYLLKPLENINDLLNPMEKAVYSYKLLLKNRELAASLQKKVEQLEKSEQKYKDLFELASDIIYTIDTKGVITSVNRKMENVTGYSREQLIGKPVDGFIEYFDKSSESRESRGGETVAVEVRIATKDSEQKYGELGMRVIEKDGNIIGAQCIVRDTSERKKVERELRSKIEDLEKFHKVSIGREMKMVELKERVKTLETKLKARHG